MEKRKESPCEPQADTKTDLRGECLWTKILQVPRGEVRGEDWPTLIVFVIVVVASPTRTSLRLSIGSRRLATLLAFDTFPTDRTGIRTTQPLLEYKGKSAYPYDRVVEGTHLQTTPVEPMGAVSDFQEYVIGQILNNPLHQRYVSYVAQVNTHIIQTDRTPFVTTRSGPFAIFPGREACDDITRRIPRFHFAQGRSKVR